MQCFPSTSLVYTVDLGKKPISTLKYGDMVKTVDTRTNKIVYTKFITYLHRDDYVLSEFIQIKTNKNKAIKMTDKHLIARMTTRNQSIEYVFAKNLNINDILVSYDDDMENSVYEEIIEIKKYVKEIGVYAPLTESGTMLVDNILVSCYANTNTQDWAHYAFKFYVYAKNVYEFLLYNLSIRRNNADKMQYGIHWYADFLMNSMPYTYTFLN
jgi:intein/homing endonuclease